MVGYGIGGLPSIYSGEADYVSNFVFMVVAMDLPRLVAFLLLHPHLLACHPQCIPLPDKILYMASVVPHVPNYVQLCFDCLHNPFLSSGYLVNNF